MRVSLKWLQPTEKEIESTIIRWIRSNHRRCQKVHSGATMIQNANKSFRKIKMADQGTPDIVACIEWLFVAIEVKSSEDKVSAWKKLRQRMEDWEELKVSQKREYRQIRQCNEILDGKGARFIVSHRTELDRLIDAMLAGWSKTNVNT